MDDVEKKLMAMSKSRVVAGAHYFAPAGFPGRRTGFALYDAQGFYAGETVRERPHGLVPHTKAAKHLARRMAEDAPKRKPRG